MSHHRKTDALRYFHIVMLQNCASTISSNSNITTSNEYNITGPEYLNIAISQY